MDFARNALDRLRSKVHLITLLVAPYVGLNISKHAIRHMVPHPMEAHEGDQDLVPIHVVRFWTGTVTLPKTSLKPATRRRRAGRDLQETLHERQDQEEAHMILHMVRPQMMLPRGAKENQKTVVPLTGDLYRPRRPRSQVHQRCQIYVSVPNLRRNRRLR